MRPKGPKGLLVILVIAGAVIAMASVALGRVGRRPSNNTAEVHGPRPAPDCRTLSPPCPPVEKPATLTHPVAFKGAGFELEPPGDVSPAFDGYEAADIAWQEGAYGGDSEQPILVLIPPGGTFTEDALAWLLVYPTACQAPSGVPPAPGYSPPVIQCIVQPGYTLIDAQSGGFIVSWTSPGDPPKP